MAGRTVRLDSTHWTGCACNGFDTQLPVQLRLSQLCSACVSDEISSQISKGDIPVLPHPNLVDCVKDLQNSYSSSFWITEPHSGIARSNFSEIAILDFIIQTDRSKPSNILTKSLPSGPKQQLCVRGSVVVVSESISKRNRKAEQRFES